MAAGVAAEEAIEVATTMATEVAIITAKAAAFTARLASPRPEVSADLVAEEDLSALVVVDLVAFE